MKNILWLFTLPILISGCTVVGLIVDSSSNNQRQKRSDSIQEVRQEIVLQKTDGDTIGAVYRDFGYVSDTAECTELSAEKSFPQIGDLVLLTMETGNREQGIFAGLMHADKQFHFIFIPDWSINKLMYYKMESISLIRDIESDLLIDQPEASQIFVHYDADNTSGCIPLSDLSHLNKQVINQRYTGTLLGLCVDATVVAITAIEVRNSLRGGLGW